MTKAKPEDDDLDVEVLTPQERLELLAKKVAAASKRVETSYGGTANSARPWPSTNR